MDVGLAIIATICSIAAALLLLAVVMEILHHKEDSIDFTISIPILGFIACLFISIVAWFFLLEKANCWTIAEPLPRLTSKAKIVPTSTPLPEDRPSVV